MGAGPGTGRGLGSCGNGVPRFLHRGMGGGFGRAGRGLGLGPAARSGAGSGPGWGYGNAMGVVDEREILERQTAAVKAELARMEKRLAELEKGDA